MFDMITYSSIYSDVLIIDYLFNKHIFKIQAQLILSLVCLEKYFHIFSKTSCM